MSALARPLVFLALAALACAPPPPAAEPPLPLEGAIASVAVRTAQGARLRGVSEAEAPELLAGVRQSARDWLEQHGRLDAAGPLALEVEIESARVRPAAVAWLFAWAAPPDHLAVRVRLRRGGETASEGRLRVESALAGWSWREPGPRRERLARRLGRRIALGL